MAAPISSYDLLKPLSDRDKFRSEFESMNEALKNFNCFAFIIHDPQQHSDFHRKMSEIFDRLDYLTGDKLLFFTLIDPPEEWLQHGRQREYFRYLGNGKALVLPNSERAITSTDKGLTAFSLAKSLNIPIDALPCIVITRDFCASRFDWVKTCEDHIREQLEELGYIASRVESKYSDLYVREAIKQRINLCEGIGSESLEVNLARALTDVLTFIIDSNNPEAQQQVVETITNLQDTLNEIKNEIKGIDHGQNLQATDLDDQLGDLCEKIVAFLAHLNTRPRQGLAGFINIETTHLEVDSRIILRTAHMVNDYLMNTRTRMIDYTPVVISLAKVFEREINLSVVHWIRQDLGVELPDYFNQHQNGCQAIFNPRSRRPIDFNKKSDPDGRWHPPAIGESKRAYEQSSQRMKAWLTNPQHFLEKWETIRQVRNQAAHTQYVGENSVRTIQTTLNHLAQNNIFGALFEMKQLGSTRGFS